MGALLIFLKICLFFFGLWFFGSRLSRWLLSGNGVLFQATFGLTLGVSLYIFLANILSYLVLPPFSFFLAFAALVLCGLLLRSKTVGSREFDLTGKQQWIVVVIALAIGSVSGLIALRTLERDDYLSAHIPAAALFAQGNFPPRDPIAPLFVHAYHYAPDLFSAALYSVTDIPLWLAYDLQTGLFSTLMFLVAFFFIYSLWHTFGVAVTTALGLLYGGNLHFLLAVPFLSTVYKKFILGYTIEHPFKLLPQIAGGQIVKPLVNQVHSHTNSLGFLLVVVVLYLFWGLYKRKLSWITFGVVGGVLFGFLALSQETTFVVLFFAFASLFLITLFTKEKSVCAGLGLCLLIAGSIVLVQGGVLSHLEIFLPTFSLAPQAVREGYTATITGSPGIKLTPMSFLLGFGLLLVLSFPAIAFLRKRMPWPLLYVFTFVIAVSLVTPLVIHYLYPGELARLFHLAAVFLAVLASMYLGWKYFEETHPIWKRRCLLVAFLALVLNGLLFQVIYSFFPLGEISWKPQLLYAVYPTPAITPLEERARAWIHKNISIGDWFFAVDFSRPYPPNHRFVVLFGRFAPTYHHTMTTPTPTMQADVYKQLLQDCRASDLRTLKFKYIFVNNLWPEGLEQRCLQNNNLTLAYEDSGQDDFTRIYRIGH